LSGGQKVASSNLAIPTWIFIKKKDWIMKIIFNAALTGLIVFLFLSGCSKSAVIDQPSITQTLVANVLSQKAVLVGEYEDGSRIIDGAVASKIITWEGFHLVLRTEDAQVLEFLSKDLFYEGDRVLIRVQDGKVLSVKPSP
jgi:hypothetical protein